MKIDPAQPLPGAVASQAAKPAAEGFRGLMEALGGAGKALAPAAASVASTASAANLGGVGTLLALQGAPQGDSRSLALRKGRRLLEALDRLQVSLLGEGPTAGNLRALQAALAEQRAPSGDSELDETLNWAEVRVAVEAAKLAR